MAPRLRTLLPAVGVLGLTASACSFGGNLPYNSAASGGGSPGGTQPAAVVTMKYVSFEPSLVTIHVGQTVEWEWQEPNVEYNVVFNHFHSQTATTGSYFHTFDTAGTFNYRCSLHAIMTGTVVVLP